MNSIFGIPIISSALAEQTVPVRRHKKRRNQSMAYHRRVQKKWLKRFGTKVEKCAFMINPSAAGLTFMGGKMMVMHPEHIALLRGLP